MSPACPLLAFFVPPLIALAHRVAYCEEERSQSEEASTNFISAITEPSKAADDAEDIDRFLLELSRETEKQLKEVTSPQRTAANAIRFLLELSPETEKQLYEVTSPEFTAAHAIMTTQGMPEDLADQIVAHIDAVAKLIIPKTDVQDLQGVSGFCHQHAVMDKVDDVQRKIIKNLQVDGHDLGTELKQSLAEIVSPERVRGFICARVWSDLIDKRRRSIGELTHVTDELTTTYSKTTFDAAELPDFLHTAKGHGNKLLKMAEEALMVEEVATIRSLLEKAETKYKAYVTDIQELQNLKQDARQARNDCITAEKQRSGVIKTD